MRWSNPFELDLRALALFRIGLGLQLLADLAVRAVDLAAHYTDAGVVPRAAIARIDADWFALHAFHGSIGWAAMLFALHAFAALALAAGYCTRLSALVCWLLTLSLCARNPEVLSGGDSLLALLLLFGAFCPLGARWSLDALAGAPAPRDSRYRGWSVALLMVQALCVLLFTAIVKSASPSWTQTGTAVHHALLARHTDFGALLLALPGPLLRAATFTVLAAEWLIPIALLSPWAARRLRSVFVPAGIALLIGLAQSLSVGALPMLEACALLLFVPSELLDAIAVRAPALSARLRKAERPRWLLLPPRVLRADAAPQTPAAKLACALLLFNVLGYNLASVPGKPVPSVVIAAPLFAKLGVDQRWVMFSAPASELSWIIAIGAREGQQVSLQHWLGGLPAEADPAARSHDPGRYRWTKLLAEVIDAPNPRVIEHLGEWLCRMQAQAGERIDGVQLFIARQAIGDAPAYGAVQLQPLHGVRCVVAR